MAEVVQENLSIEIEEKLSEMKKYVNELKSWLDNVNDKSEKIYLKSAEPSCGKSSLAHRMHAQEGDHNDSNLKINDMPSVISKTSFDDQNEI